MIISLGNRELFTGCFSYVDESQIICLEGGVDVQQTMHGNSKDLRKKGRKRAEEFGLDGVYILAPSHNLGDDMPFNNILALYKD